MRYVLTICLCLVSAVTEAQVRGAEYGSARAARNFERNATRTRDYRTWTDDTGKFTVRAKYLGVTDEKLIMAKMDGVRIVVPYERLSSRDQEWVLSQLPHEWPPKKLEAKRKKVEKGPKGPVWYPGASKK